MPYPDGVAKTLQTGTNIVRRELENARDIFSDDPTQSNFSDQPRKLRPQIPVVPFRFLLSSHAEGLTGKTSVDKLDWRYSCIDHHLF
jgi:hypothetical protein